MSNLKAKSEDYMDIQLSIPREFVYHFYTDRFDDSINRCLLDLKDLRFKGVSGRYDHEVLSMLLSSFKSAKVLRRSASYGGDICSESCKFYNSLGCPYLGTNNTGIYCDEFRNHDQEVF